jgi:protein gp37
MDAAWARSVIRDCQALGVAPFFKQWGAIANNPLVSEHAMAPKAAAAADPHGKGGGLLDGQLYRDFPNSRGFLTVAA